MTLLNTETKEVVGGHAFPITATCERSGVSVHALESAGSLLAWDNVLTDCVTKIASFVHGYRRTASVGVAILDMETALTDCDKP